jgi:pyridoxal phosphate enzyme (YggS family)
MIRDTIEQVQERLDKALVRAHRQKDSVMLLAVSKMKPLSDIQQAIAAGLRHFGENYIQEAEEKIVALQEIFSQDKNFLSISWHAIGAVQSNKIKKVLQHFNWFHGLYSENQALEFAKLLRKDPNVRAPKILLQLNLEDETSKAGLRDHEIEPFAEKIEQLDAFEVCGLMIIPPFSQTPEQRRKSFASTRQWQQRLNAKKLKQVKITELSMGMSDDFEVAIEEGATMVRVGAAIFGKR